MKFKKTLLLICLVICLFTVASVCASDAKDTEISSDDASQFDLSQSEKIAKDTLKLTEENSNDNADGQQISKDGSESDVLNVANEENRLSATQSFKDLNDTINGNQNYTIDLYDDYEYTTGDDAFIGGIEISRDVIIDGHGVTINGSNQAVIFKVISGAVILKNISFVNGNAQFNCGGAIYSDSNSINISDCCFANNSARYGGAIYFNSGLINSNINATFINNNANMYGAAIYFNGAVTDVEISGNFTDNKAKMRGGVNYFVDEGINISISGNYVNNIAESSNGGVNYFGARLTNAEISGNYSSNKAKSGSGVNCFEGEVNTLWISGNYVNNSVDGGSGGVNYFGARLTNAEISGNFTDNKVNLNGGVNYFRGEVNTVRISGNYVNNTADNWGGANYFNVEVINVGISGNYNNNTANMGGGANYFYKSINNVNITGRYTNNTSKNRYGGANDFEGQLTNVDISGEYIANKAFSGGGANYFYVSINNVNITGNYVDNIADNSDGGANYFDNQLTNVRLSGNYTNNTARKGGANYFYGQLSNVNLSASYLGNNAYNGGDAYFFENELNNVAITGNFIDNTGDSVIYIANSNQNNMIMDSIFINNGANNIQVTSGHIQVINNWFGNNVSNYNVNPQAGVDLDNWLFLNATANPDTIPAFASSDINFKLSSYNASQNVSEYDNSRLMPVSLTITSTNGNLNDSIARLGKTIKYTANGVGTGSVTASLGNVAYNIVLDVYKANPELSAENLVITHGENATLTLNYSTNATGKVNITFTGKNGIITYKNLDLNTTIVFSDEFVPDVYEVNVTYSGDDNFLNATAHASLTVTDGTTFWDLNRTINGNANGTVTLDRNYAYNLTTDSAFGEGIVINRSVTIIGDGHTINADGKARIFYVSSDDVVLKDITFKNGNAAGSGGAIWANNIDVSCCIFVNNSADNGGAIMCDNGNANISCCIFANNTANNGILYFNNTYSNINFTINNNIFLGHDKGSEISFYNPGGNFNIDYNWFENDATNYEVQPTFNNAKPNVWLFLNATADPNTIPVFASSVIIFKLFAYNGTSQNVSEYDNSRLMPVNLTVTSINGDINDSIVKLCEAIKYTANSAGTGSVTASLENVAYTLVFEVDKTNPELSAENLVITHGENATLTLNYNTNATGKVNITFTGKKGNRTYINLDLNTTIVFSDEFVPDVYEVNVTYSGDGNFLNATAHASLTVTDGTTFWDLNRTINGNANATITLDRNYTYNLTTDSAFGEGIVINRPVTITGNGHTINADGKARIFYVSSDDVVLDDITFKNANSVRYGGAVFFNQGGDVTNCNFVNNTAAYGGAVLFSQSANVTNSNL